MERRGKGDPNIEASLSVEIDRPLAMGLFLAYLSAERDALDARIAAMREGPMRSVKSNKQMRVIDDKLRKIDDASARRRCTPRAVIRQPAFECKLSRVGAPHWLGTGARYDLTSAQ
jgi:hypothetical protein